MPLILRVVRYQQRPPDQPLSVSFGPRGGTVGRGPHNDWVLPDPKRFVSGRHAAVHREPDGYYITDTSANGVYINGSPRSLGRGGSALLRDGDRLVLGEYEISVAESADELTDGALDAELSQSRGTGDFRGRAARIGDDAGGVFGTSTAPTEMQPRRLSPGPADEGASHARHPSGPDL